MTNKDGRNMAVRGRPPKFQEERRPITVTLPERILEKLTALNPDRAKAIVKCVEAVSGDNTKGSERVDVVEVLPGKALIVVGVSRVLKSISWLRLAEIMPGRYLLVLPPATSIESLEVELHDLIQTLGPEDASERGILQKLHDTLGLSRRRKALSKAELIFVDVSR